MKPEIKQDWLKRAQDHAAADRFIKGKWLNGMVGEYKSGCFFGCMTQCEDDTLELAAEQMNSPLWLVELAEAIFEGLPDRQAEAFPVQYLQAIPDRLSDEQYESLFHRTGYLRMQRLLAIVQKIETEDDYKQECIEAITMVADFHLSPSESSRSAALAAAESAAETAAWESACSAACSAAWSAADLAAESARSATWSNEYINERNDLFLAFSELSRVG